MLAHDGARHFLSGPKLGNAIDSENDGQPNSGATGDDIAGIDDEDLSFGTVIAGRSGTVDVEVTDGPAMLDKLRIEFTKSRARRTNDNALVESKNASVVRKHLGYSHIPGPYASLVNAFLRDFLTPYLNFHRPCFFPETILDAKGRQRRRYRYEHMNTPYERLKAIPDSARFLKPGLSFRDLNQIALSLTDSQAALRLNQAREILFNQIKPPKAA